MYCMANGDLHRIFNSADDSIDDSTKVREYKLVMEMYEILLVEITPDFYRYSFLIPPI